MRKLFLWILAAFSIPAAHAQVQLGIKAGMNISTVNTNNYGKISMKTGLIAGGIVSLPLFSHISLQPEIMYSAQGAKSTENNVTSNLNIDYVDIPLLVKYNHPSGFFVESGPQLGLLLNAKLLLPNYNEDMKYNYRSSDFAWAFGLGYLIKDANVGIDARYNLGISNFFKDTYIGDAQHNVIQVSLFFLFGVKTTKTDQGL
ncbi:MAG: porin family protein [Chitinophagales bacterium]